jgi:hypothetical protein
VYEVPQAMFVHQVVKNVRFQPGVSELANLDGYMSLCYMGG